jgi:aminoglycoside phosphotransferase (APT) family kinase protein
MPDADRSPIPELMVSGLAAILRRRRSGSVLLHGDLIPGNLLLADGRLTSVHDWDSLAAGNHAQNLDPAWAVL